ncbi:MAG: Hsp33 family molecular chaperone HslO, partial [Myxococcota bacterium]
MAKETTDRAVRTLTEDGGFRVITAVTTQTVREALKRQEASGHAVGLLGGLITGAVLIREAMTPEQRVQILIKSRAGRHLAVADAHPDGRNRGLLRAGADDELSATAGPAGDSNGDSDNGAAHGALLEVIYTLPNGIIHQSMSALPADGDLS